MQRNIRWVFICTLLKNKLQRSVVISKTVITGGEIIKATPLEGTFSECLMKQIEELEERKNRKIRGEDKN